MIMHILKYKEIRRKPQPATVLVNTSNPNVLEAKPMSMQNATERFGFCINLNWNLF